MPHSRDVDVGGGARRTAPPRPLRGRRLRPIFFAEEAASGAQLQRTAAERGGREVKHDGSSLTKLGGGHDGHRPRNADGGDCRLPPAHAPPQATATTTTTTMTTVTMTTIKTMRGGCCGRSWRTPPQQQWTSSCQGGLGRWWRATTTVTTTTKEAILPYQTMPLPAAAGAMTMRRCRCKVAGGRLMEEGGTSSPER